MRTIYISGPMTGMPEHNFPEFRAAAERFRSWGWNVINPADSFGGDTSLPREVYLRRDIEGLLRADAIAFLPGWESSAGANVEREVAEAIGLAPYDAETGEPLGDYHPARFDLPEGSALYDAALHVHGDRRRAYGHPAEDFGRTAKLWSAILGATVTRRHVALCMVALKISREVNQPNHDNRVDGAGYFETLELVDQWERGTEPAPSRGFTIE